MSDKVTAPRLLEMKRRGERIVCITAYDVEFARIADRAGVDVVLVGDSLGNVVLGYDSTLPVTLDDMEHHVRAARAGVSRALLVGDLPFGSYHASIPQAVESAVRLMKAGAQAVKLEGAYPEVVAALVRAGIPTMGHLGFTPQAVHKFGGHRVQGRGDAGETLLAEAKALDEAGACGIVLELVPAVVASRIGPQIVAPTIGIGAGVGCDGQVQVLHDVLGLTGRPFKHAKRYAELGAIAERALVEYTQEVRDGSFPTEAQSF